MKAEEKNDILDEMETTGLLSYGSVMSRESFLAWFGIDHVTDDQIEQMKPAVIRKRLQDESLQELSAADFVRRSLLKLGRYFYCEHGEYRVALPSENAAIAEKYIQSSRKKLGKASLLIKTTPAEYMTADSLKSRAALAHAFSVKQEGRISH